LIVVRRFGEFEHSRVASVLQRYGLQLCVAEPTADIPGSYWGEAEAGLVGDVLHVRRDTPMHSVLHEAAHYVCMSGERRARLERDAGGDDLEECAVCYLQIVLADHIEGFDRARALSDMDAWGYNFRFGSAEQWFREDSDDARIWLQSESVLDSEGAVTFRLRS
jgi:hypothetical protein